MGYAGIHGVAAPVAARRVAVRLPRPGPDPAGERIAAGRLRDGDDVRRRRRTNLSQALSLSYRAPLEIVRGAGTFLFDHTGRAFSTW